MFNLLKRKEKELMFSMVEGVKFVSFVSQTRSNLKKFDYIQGLMSNLPQIVKDKMKEKNLIVRLVEEDEMLELGSSNRVLGFYSIANIEIIYIKSNQSYDRLENTFYHEVGHFVDRYIGEKIGCQFISLNEKDFQEIAFDESHAYSFDYYRQNIKEYFAQSFAEFIKQSNLLSKMPRTHIYMGSYVECLKVI